MDGKIYLWKLTKISSEEDRDLREHTYFKRDHHLPPKQTSANGNGFHCVLPSSSAAQSVMLSCLQEAAEAARMDSPRHKEANGED